MLPDPHPRRDPAEDPSGQAPQPPPDAGQADAPGRRREDRGEDFELPEGFDNEETVVLVTRSKDGDSDALNDLFARYHAIMVELARQRIGGRLRLKEDPQDLAQTTFREAARDFRRYEYRGPGSMLRWLVQILQNKIRDKAEYYSAGKRDASLETALDAPIDRSTDFESGPEPQSPDLSVTRVVQRDERFQMLREALAELTPEHRQAITLVFFEGLSLREAGARMGGRSEDALRMLLRRAERKLGDLIKRNHGEI
jgi:RNA polymerase sigma-70 factor (ECF subfamily)